MDTSITYTPEPIEFKCPIYINVRVNIRDEHDVDSSLDFDKSLQTSSFLLGWRFSLTTFPVPKEGFIGILTNDEAREMKERITLFKKRFNDDFDRRNKRLFGE